MSDAPSTSTHGSSALKSDARWIVSDDCADMLHDFALEARGLLDQAESACLSLETDLNQGGIALAFRAFHTIKGVAGFLELEVLAHVSHRVESVLSDVRDGAPAPPGFIDLLLSAIDVVRGCLRVASHAGEGDRPDVVGLLARVDLATGQTVAPVAEVADEIVAVVDAVAPAPAPVATAPIAPVPIATAPAAEAPVPPAPTAAADAPRATADEAAVRVDIGKLDHILDLVGELAIAQAQVSAHPDLSQLRAEGLLRSIAQVGRVARDLQRASLAMRMVTIKTTFDRMARIARDTARNLGKLVQFTTEGGQTELDRTMVDAIYDPLVHLVRNAIDHGLEGRIERVRRGKSEAGRIAMRAYHKSGHIVVEIADDGGGLDRDKILARARSRGLITSEGRPSDDEIDRMIFLPGFSTAEKVTSVSGRGVGLDVVRNNIEAVRGRVEIESTPGSGSLFRLHVPLTLAIIDGILLGLGEDRYVLPASWVRDVFRPRAEQITTVQGRGEMVSVRGRLYPIRRLSDDLGGGSSDLAPSAGVLVMVDDGVTPTCLLVDRLLGKQEVVVKNLGSMLAHVRGIAGGAILGDGRIALILDIPTLVARRSDGLVPYGEPARA